MSKDSVFRRKLQRGGLMKSRDRSILDFCRNKSVVHIGCTDSPFTELRLSEGGLLHQKLTPAATRILGVDIDSKGLSLLKDSLGGEYLNVDIQEYSNIQDVTQEEVFGFVPDVIVLGDVIEHLSDQTQILKTMSNLTKGSDTQILITTPNSLGLRNTLNSILGYELMHPEHLLIHSPTTLRTVLAAGGLEPMTWHFYSIQTGSDLPHRLYDAICHLSAHLRPAWADGHFVVCTPMSDL